MAKSEERNTRRPPRIATLTLNPAVDVSYEVHTLEPDRKSHALSTRFDPGGNGINVARGLQALGVAAHSCCFIGGRVGLLLKDLLGQELHHSHWVQVPGETRINATVLQQEPRAQFEVTGNGPLVGPVHLDDITELFLRLAGGGFAVITGSTPPGVPAGYYADLVRRASAQGARVVADLNGPQLAEVLDEKPFLVKPNLYELEQHCGRPIGSMEAAAAEALRLNETGVANVCVSLGAAGALLASRGRCLHASAPPIEVRSTVGAGDSTVAGLVAALAAGRSPEEALALGVACGSGTAAKPGTAIFDWPQVEALMSAVEISECAPGG
ncbi:MAG: 1-phosphofructokinase family hexose kinase [Actinomycetota bacterium]|nr:1-phosphofructokinase family hexose kinase [Actinomycetota bacterium]